MKKMQYIMSCICEVILMMRKKYHDGYFPAQLLVCLMATYLLVGDNILLACIAHAMQWIFTE